MADLFTLSTLGTLFMLIFLQAVLGFDNLLYISIQSQRAPAEKQKSVRFWGIIIAVALRVVLLFVVSGLIGALSEPFFVFNVPGIIEGGVNFATVVFVFGGGFIMYTAVREIAHMLSIDDLHHDTSPKNHQSATSVVLLIVMMNLIFSFDSILSALAITDQFVLLAAAILTSGLAMLLLADHVTVFLQKNRMYEVLGLFILLIVGVVLLGEAGTAASHAMHDESLHIKLFNHAVTPMSKSTFYFSVVVLFAVEIIQTGYSRKLAKVRAATQKGH
ncbi:TerC family protein [Falsihalocynthiibacter sp. SS001]|uniref:TerC family protein n=1 Tax=Falsihalocynthiibacter sp. SS001 TaxID=3349698 RepID=UPI0036D3A5E0